jgi:hypothetical protein
MACITSRSERKNGYSTVVYRDERSCWYDRDVKSDLRENASGIGVDDTRTACFLSVLRKGPGMYKDRTEQDLRWCVCYRLFSLSHAIERGQCIVMQ